MKKKISICVDEEILIALKKRLKEDYKDFSLSELINLKLKDSIFNEYY